MSYPSGSMTLPKPAVKKQQQQTSQHHDTKVKFSDDKVTSSSHDTKVTFSDSKVTFKGLPSEEKVAFRNNNNNLLPTTTTEVVKKITPTDNNNISQQVKFGDNVKVVTTSTSTYDSKVTFKGLSPAVVVSEDKVTFSRGHSEVKKPTPPTTTSTPAQDASQITKPHESGESDPGYESDSSKSKPHHEQAAVEQQKQQQNSEQQQQQQHQKACTLPRRSAKVSVQPSSSTLDRRKLKSLADSEAGVTVEIISPIRVRY